MCSFVTPGLVCCWVACCFGLFVVSVGFGGCWGWLVGAGVFGCYVGFLVVIACRCLRVAGLVSLVYWNDGVPVWVLVWVAVAELGWCGDWL